MALQASKVSLGVLVVNDLVRRDLVCYRSEALVPLLVLGVLLRFRGAEGPDVATDCVVGFYFLNVVSEFVHFNSNIVV